MSEEMNDVLIIGAGPAGLTSAIYTSRELHKTLILEKAAAGGLPITTHLIENYPGFPKAIPGTELMERMKAQALRFGAKLTEFAEVKSLKKEEGFFTVATDSGVYRSKTVIVASGSAPKSLGIEGEERLRGRGVSYCGICDGPFFAGMDIAIIGGGNSGLQEGEFLLKFAKSIKFVEFLPYIPGSKILQKRLHETGKVRFIANHEVTSINGAEFVESITIKGRTRHEAQKLDVAGVFVYAGFVPNAGFMGDLAQFDKGGYIITNERMQTSTPGLFAAGDICAKQIRQITGATSAGTLAGIYAGGIAGE